jgi:Terminase large subunit, endonuclease domain
MRIYKKVLSRRNGRCPPPPNYEAGHVGILFHAKRPSLEPLPEMEDAELLGLLAEVYSGAPWVDIGRLLREARDPGAPWPETQRFFFNLPSSGVLTAVDPTVWADRKRSRELEPDEPIALGFDGSHSRDGTALCGCMRDGWVFPVEIIERPPNADDDWRIDRTPIHRAVEFMFTTYNVAALYADPWQWQSELDAWTEQWPDRVIAWPTNSNRRMAPAVDRFRSAISEGHLTHDGDPRLTRHVLNARLRHAGRDDDGRGLYVLEKAGAAPLHRRLRRRAARVRGARRDRPRAGTPRPICVRLMTDETPKTIKIPNDWQPAESLEPFVLDSSDGDERDVTKPIAYDELGQPLYAPKGIRLQ